MTSSAKRQLAGAVGVAATHDAGAGVAAAQRRRVESGRLSANSSIVARWSAPNTTTGVSGQRGEGERLRLERAAL